MCGISAIVKHSNVSLPIEVVKQFNNCITHRGPDGPGYQFFNNGETTNDGDWNVALAHQRLSIIDLSDNGNQPMPFSKGKRWIIFNGEIYNYVEIKAQLLAKGYSFQNESDTEVILAAYEEWGTGAFEKLRGMWGLLIFDKEKNKLIACRDRMGIKPLYVYTSSKGYVAFASEIKQFLKLPDFVPVADKAVVKQYLLTGFERTDRTFFENIKPVLPGTFTEINITTLTFNAAVSFWRPEAIIPSVKRIEEATDIFKHELQESMRIHLRSDVPVGCQLSGGVDSSSIFALMQQYYTGTSIHSFTVQFPGFEKDETPFVQKMLEGSNALPHFVTPDPETFRNEVHKFIWHHDEPVGSFAHYAGFVLARLIAEHKIKVVLNGQGADEILGGYWQQYFTYLFSLGKRGRVSGLFSHVLGALGKEGNEELLKQVPSMVRRYRSRNRQQPFELTKKFSDVPSLHFFDDYFAMSNQERRVFEIRNLILPRLLKWDDRNLMAFGIEGRYPFLDHKVIEAALSFDSSVLFKHGWTKYPLRMAMKDKIPKEIYFRKSKWGFETPQQNWLKEALRPMLTDWMKKEKPLDQVIGQASITAMINKFWESGKMEDAQLLLRLFLLDQWFQIFSVRV